MGSPGPSLLTEAGCAEVPGVMTLLPFLIRARSCWHSHTQSLTLCSSSSALVSLGVGTAGMCSFRQWHVGNFEFVAFKKCYLIELISGSYCKINLNWCDGYKLWKETMQKIILKAPQSLRKHCSRDLKPELGCSITQWCGHSSYWYLSPQAAIHRHFHCSCDPVGAVVATLHVELFKFPVALYSVCWSL